MRKRMKEFPMHRATYYRRLFQAQLNYIELIKKGVFDHDLRKAKAVAYVYSGAAVIESIKMSARKIIHI